MSGELLIVQGLVFSVIWGFICSLIYSTYYDSHSMFRTIMFFSPVFFLIIYSFSEQRLVLSSFILSAGSWLFIYIILELDSVNREFHNFEAENPLKTLELLHFCSKYTELIRTTILIGAVVGFVSIMPIILYAKGATLVYNMILHIIILICTSLFFAFIIAYDDYRHTDIKIENGYLRWFEQNSEIKIKISDIDNIEEKFLRVKIETEHNKEVIWTTNPSKFSNSVVANSI